MRPSLFTLALSALCALGTSGCATDYVARQAAVRSAYERYDEAKALTLLEREEKEGRDIDKLLVLLDKGTILHAAGRWQESIDVLTKADELAQQVDATSVTEEVGAVLSNEGTKLYRGEDFEKLMISVLLALNYFELGKEEDALVEVRRCNERLDKMVSKEAKKYEQLPIARYLGGVLYENEHELDSAAIDYLKAVELFPQIGDAAAPALRLAKATGRDDAYQELLKKFPNVAHEPISKTMGQVVVLLELGKAPRKQSSQRKHGVDFIVVPQYPAKAPALPEQTVEIAGVALKSHVVTSVNDVAHRYLEERIGKLIAKSVASLAVKAGAGIAVGALTGSKELGAATFLLLSLTQQADTRSWLSLPAEFQVARTEVKPGQVQVTVKARGKTSTHEVEVKAGKIALLVVRRY